VSPAFKATKARIVLAALERIGWTIARQKGSHRTLQRTGWAPVTFAFHDGEELGPVMLSKIAKTTGLTPDDL
jgi:predicted RNA binding protein YcfA (HicA-like mRNA interferase family)